MEAAVLAVPIIVELPVVPRALAHVEVVVPDVPQHVRLRVEKAAQQHAVPAPVVAEAVLKLVEVIVRLRVEVAARLAVLIVAVTVLEIVFPTVAVAVADAQLIVLRGVLPLAKDIVRQRVNCLVVHVTPHARQIVLPAVPEAVRQIVQKHQEQVVPQLVEIVVLETVSLDAVEPVMAVRAVVQKDVHRVVRALVKMCVQVAVMVAVQQRVLVAPTLVRVVLVAVVVVK